MSAIVKRKGPADVIKIIATMRKKTGTGMRARGNRRKLTWINFVAYPSLSVCTQIFLSYTPTTIRVSLLSIRFGIDTAMCLVNGCRSLREHAPDVSSVHLSRNHLLDYEISSPLAWVSADNAISSIFKAWRMATSNSF